MTVDKLFRLVPVALVLAAGLGGCHQQPAATSDEQLSVTKVSDGDTFTGVDQAGERVRVRLLGMDAPELAHNGKAADCGATEAKDALEQLLHGQDVTLVDDPQADRLDRYGRRLAYVDIGGVDAALHQIQGGQAEAWYPRGEPRPQRHQAYKQAERVARDSRAGAWSTCPRLGR